MRILYLAGWGRSGSTILSSILGQVDGISALGELRLLWENAFIDVDRCGCGNLIPECEFWSEVISKALGPLDDRQAERCIRRRDALTRTRHLPHHLHPRLRRRLFARDPQLIVAMERLYRQLFAVAGVDVIIDSSKIPSYAMLLSQFRSIELEVVHLVRDPRATAYSWSRGKASRGPVHERELPRYGVVKNSVNWIVQNLATEWLFDGSKRIGYVRQRYEDFASNPKNAVERLLELLPGEFAPPEFVDDVSIQLQESHSVSGNPVRLTTGPMKVEEDERWKSEMPRASKWLVTALTWPLLLRYEYAISVHRQERKE